MSNYRTTYDAWMADPLGFWAAAATAVDWIASPTESVVDPQGLASWFADGTCNVCWNAVDRHVVAGRGNEAALIYDSAILGISKTLTFSQLLDAVELFASVLRSHGGDAGAARCGWSHRPPCSLPDSLPISLPRVSSMESL